MDDCGDMCGIVAPGLTVGMSVCICVGEVLADEVGWKIGIGRDRPGTGTVSDWLIFVLVGSSSVRVVVWLIVITAGSEFCATPSVLHCTIVVVSTISAKCIECHIK